MIHTGETIEAPKAKKLIIKIIDITIVEGDTLKTLEADFTTTKETLFMINNKQKLLNLKIGMLIKVPVLHPVED